MPRAEARVRTCSQFLFNVNIWLVFDLSINDLATNNLNVQNSRTLLLSTAAMSCRENSCRCLLLSEWNERCDIWTESMWMTAMIGDVFLNFKDLSRAF